MSRLIDADALLDALSKKLMTEVFPDWNTLPPDDRRRLCTLGEVYKREIESMPTVYGWISVKDKLPETDCEVLVACRSKSGMYNVDKGYHNGARMVHRGHAEVTHWMELPDAPKEELGGMNK